MSMVDVFVGNNVQIDQDVYSLWLGGYSAQEAASFLQRHGVLQQYNVTFDMLLSDTMDQYRTFYLLEKLLQQPPRMSEQIVYQIKPEIQNQLVQKYFEFDASVMREILGKKMSARNRKDLDDVSEKTRVPLRSCRRQFDNVKRVFKTVEDMMGSLVDNIKTHFLLNNDLAQQYAAIVFITNNRFETGKKKLNYLQLEDFVHCATQMIHHWSYSSKDCSAHEDMDVDFDRQFLFNLRELKVLIEKDYLEEHKLSVTRIVKGKVTSSAFNDLDSNFKNYSKVFINIAYSLNHSKDLRDFFVDIVEMYIEPCKSALWTKGDVDCFLTTYQETAHQLEPLTKDPHLSKTWDRYMNTVTSCIQQLYHS